MVSLPSPTAYFLDLVLLVLCTQFSFLHRGGVLLHSSLLFCPILLSCIVSGPVCAKGLVVPGGLLPMFLQIPHTARDTLQGWTVPSPVLQTKRNKLTQLIWSAICMHPVTQIKCFMHI